MIHMKRRTYEDVKHGDDFRIHYDNVIMTAMASQITNLTIVYSTVYSGADQRKHQSSASLAFVRGIHRWLVNSPHKGPVTRKMFPFDGVIKGPLWGNPTVTSQRTSKAELKYFFVLDVVSLIHIHIHIQIHIHIHIHTCIYTPLDLLLRLHWCQSNASQTTIKGYI